MGTARPDSTVKPATVFVTRPERLAPVAGFGIIQDRLPYLSA